MILRLIALALALIPNAAAAQTTTQCRWVFNTWTCNETSHAPAKPYDYSIDTPAPGEAFLRGYRQGQELRKLREEAERSAAENSTAVQARIAEEKARKESENRSVVAILLREGKCEQAVDKALSSGDIALATEAKKFCGN